MRQVGHRQQPIAHALLHGLEIAFERRQLVADAGDLAQHRRCVFAPAFGDADLLRDRVAPRLQLLGAHLDVLALGLERDERGRVELIATRLQARGDGIEIVAQKLDIEHARILAEGCAPPARQRGQDSPSPPERALASRCFNSASLSAILASRPRSVGRYQSRPRHAVGKIVLAGGVGIGLVVRVAIILAVAQILHQPRRRVAQVQRHRARPVFGDERARRVVRDVHRIALGGAGEIDHRFAPARARLRACRAARRSRPRRASAAARADRRVRCPRSPCAPCAARRRADRRRRRACGRTSTAPHRDRMPRTDLCSAEIWS